MTTGKRQAIADFGFYSICQGQKEIGPIGYSPLPVNLVEAGFGQLQKLQAADSGVDLTSQNILNCNNPTFDKNDPNTNYLATIAPLPPSCDQVGAGPCAAGVTPNGIGATPTSSGSYPGGSGGPGSSGASSGTGGSATGAGTGASASDTATTGAAQSGSKGAGNSANDAPAATIQNVTLAGTDPSTYLRTWSPLALVLLLLVFGIPVFLGLRRQRRRGGESS
jgi:hypothetical protein